MPRDIFADFGSLAARLDLPDHVTETARNIYAQIRTIGAGNRKNLEVIIPAASLLAGCRVNNYPFTAHFISQATDGAHPAEIERKYHQIKNRLCLNTNILPPQRYIPLFCAEITSKAKGIQIPLAVQNRAVEILDMARGKDETLYSLVEPQQPMYRLNEEIARYAYAAAAIYTAMLEHDLENQTLTKISQRQISDAIGITDVTLRKKYHELADLLGLFK